MVENMAEIVAENMAEKFTVACVQTTSARDIASNIPVNADFVRRARDAGADFITLPECVGMLEPDNRRLRAGAPSEAGHDGLSALRDLAIETGAWILAGSLSVKTAAGKIANRSYLIGADGDIKATYDKIHMFDVDLGGGESYRESATFEPGTAAVIAPLPWGRLGMTICYDLRFPHLYRDLAQDGAQFFAIPAAFTRPTGQAHWHVLQRARAIENGCYVFAPAQCGEHADGRLTYGHSLIVDPWGEILADGGEEPGIITAEIDLARVAEARAKIPSLEHDRLYSAADPVSAAAEDGARAPRTRRRAAS